MTDKVGKKTRFSINVTQVPVEGKRFEFLIDPRWIEEQLSDCEIFSPFEDGRLHLMVSPVGENYHLKGEAHLAFKMTCVRCLRDVVVSLSVPLSIVATREDSGSILPRGRRGDVGVVRFTGDEIVLDDEVREAVVVELPMNPKCPDGCSIKDLYRDS